MIKEIHNVRTGEVTFVEMTQEEIDQHNEISARVIAQMAVQPVSEIETLKARLTALEAKTTKG